MQSEHIPAARVIQLEGQDRGYEDFKDAVPVDNSFFHKLLRASYIVDGTKNILTDIQITPQATVFILAGIQPEAEDFQLIVASAKMLLKKDHASWP